MSGPERPAILPLMADVHFCNLCDRSVPLDEVQDGSCAQVGERLICPECLDLLGVAGTSSGGRGLALAGIGLVAVLAVVLGLLWTRTDEVAQDLSGRLNTAEQALETRAGELAGARAEADEALAGELALVRQEVQYLRAAADELGGRIDLGLAELGASVAALEPLVDQQDELAQGQIRMEATLSVVEDRQRASRGNLEGLRDRIQRLEDRTEALAAAAPSDDQNEFSGEISGLLRKLQDEDPEVRYAALEKLSAMQDERLLPHLYPLLADPYEFTRFLAAHTFSEWDARPAVPHLVEALLDEVSFVREAAVRALRRITGQNFGYQHEGDDQAARDARRTAYESWRMWWEANSAAFLNG